jgi:vacuolar-type H+-ATPase subunit F/Vma7
MSSFDKIAVIGDPDLVFGLRGLGFHVFSPRDVDEAGKILARIAKEDFAVCLVHQSWLDALAEERAAIREKFCPVIVGFSDYRSAVDEMEKTVREMARRATGSDSLVKRKGNHE